jgi:hypothetical protein
VYMGDVMTAQRKFLIAESSIRLILKEVAAIKKCAVSTPDIEASYKTVVGILEGLGGA